MKDVMQLTGNVHILGNVVMIEFKFREREQVLDVLHFSGNEVIHTNNVITFPYETIAQV
jgi:hypothetical protein